MVLVHTLIRFIKLFLAIFMSKPKSPVSALASEDDPNHWINCSDEFTELGLKQCFYRNEEMNNNLPTSMGRSIKIVEANPESITLSWLPNIPELFNPGNNNQWALLILDFPEEIRDPGAGGFDYTDSLLITGGDYDSRTLNYQAEIHTSLTKWKNRHVVLYNPFRNWDIRPAPLVNLPKNAAWCSKYIAPAAMFQRSDGKYILLANGENRKTFAEAPTQQVGAFISADPWNEPFTPLNNNESYFKHNEVPQMQDSFQITSLIRSEEPGYWIGYGNGRSGTDWNIVAVKFDEDFRDFQYYTELLKSKPKVKNGMYFPTVIKYQDSYRMMWVNRWEKNPASWDLYEGLADSELGKFDFNRVKSNPVLKPATHNDGIFRSNHTHQPTYFIENDSLYLTYDGTSRWKTSGNRGNRLFGVARYNSDLEMWIEDARNPLFINPLYGDRLWGPQWNWCNDHLGGVQFLYRLDSQKVLFFYSACAGRDSYRIACARIK